MPTSSTNPSLRPVSSPAASGGSGTFFEQDVNALYLAILLVKGIPPLFSDGFLSEVAFQTEHVGWNTDDALLTVATASGVKRYIALQVKRTFALQKSDEDCTKAIGDFWKDFANAKPFTEGTDALALCVQSGGGDSAVKSIRSLCDIARAANNSADFFNRLSLEGYTNKAVKKAEQTIRSIVQDIDADVTDDLLWRFLKSLHAFTSDLGLAVSQAGGSVKSLLALTASGHDKVGDANASWNELLALAAKGMPHAEVISWEKLPASLRGRHTSIGVTAGAAMAKATEHSQTTLAKIQTKLANQITLHRTTVRMEVLAAITETPITLITGAAGSGKSALARFVVDQLSAEATVLAFRAEEFAVPHLDQALQQAQIPANSKTIKAALAGQATKIILIEGVERLLEASTCEAFGDLLSICATDKSWRIVLTCRDYSVDIISSAFLESLEMTTQIVRVPPLSDEELEQVSEARPDLVRPLSHPVLHELFRKPYILDKALRMEWPAGDAVPNDEQSFRRKFWKEVVRGEKDAQGGMPRRRQETLIELCLRRARSLQPFASTDALDHEALNRLRGDDLVEYSQSSDSVASPTHDVLEDWCVIEWIQGRFEVNGSNASLFEAEIGTFPAVRRGFRKWLRGLVVNDAATADNFILRVVQDATLTNHFRDDVFGAVLSSPSGGEFLLRNSALLMADSAALLKRAVHLVRVSCKSTPPWAKTLNASGWFVPSGPAWPAILKIIARELTTLVPKEVGLIAGLLSDWAGGPFLIPPPSDGAADAFSIALSLLPYVDDYSNRDLQKSIVQLIARIPRGDLTAFSKFADRAVAADNDDEAAEQFRDFLLSGADSIEACKYAPDDVVRVFMSAVFLPVDKTGQRHRYSSDIDANFGMQDHLRRDFFPASSTQGPFLALLRHHPVKAIVFVIRFVNRACDSYSNRQINTQLEPPEKLSLQLPDGSSREYWSNWRLWGMYRGCSVAPYAVQSALMALETVLLEMCELEGVDIELWLTRILREANNVGIIAVVASVAMAYPLKAGKVSLALLSSKVLIDLDRARCVADIHNPVLSIPLPSVVQQVADQERRTSQKLPHRQQTLEMLAFRLQFTPLKEEVWAVLDKHLASLPPASKQSEEDKLTRLSIKRMDARGYEVRQHTVATPSVDGADATEQAAQSGLLLVQKPLEGDLQAVVDESLPEQEQIVQVSSIFQWAHKTYKFEEVAGSAWDAQLRAAQALPSDGPSPIGPWLFDAPVFAAAVCIRDHWDELTAEDRSWCTNKLIDVIMFDADTEDISIRLSRSTLEGVEPAASTLPLLLTRDIDGPTRSRVLKTLSVALTHSVEKVPLLTAAAIGRHLASSHNELMLGFVRLIVIQARELTALDELDRQRPYKERERHDALRKRVRENLRQNSSWEIPCTAEDLDSISLDSWPGKTAYKSLMPLFLTCSGEPLAKKLFSVIAQWLSESWSDNPVSRRNRDFHYESDCEHYLAPFVLKLPTQTALEVLAPVFHSIESQPKDVGDFVKALVSAADTGEAFAPFWPIWRVLSDTILKASWIARLQDRYPRDQGLLSAMFLNISWKDGIAHWRGLGNNGPLLGEFFSKLPPLPVVFASYIRFLYRIGERSLPNAFKVLADRLAAGVPREILGVTDTLFCTEQLLHRFAYGRPALIKADAGLTQSVLALLDYLIEAGSSSAYRMRDHFVTPARLSQLDFQE